MRSRIHLGLIVQPSRHIPHRHVVSIRVAVTGFADNGIHAGGEGDLGGASFAEEFGVEVDAFAVDLVDVLGGIGKVTRVEVPADAELVAAVELDSLVFESFVDGLGDVSLQTGYVTVLHSDDAGFPVGQVKMDLSTWVSN